MATTTIYANKDARIADSGGTSLGAGASDYLPVGLYSGFKYRSLIGFSYSFTGWTAITAATLYLKTSPQNYVAFGSDPDIYVQRITESWSEGTSVSMSGTNAVEWSNQPSSTTSNRATKDVSTVENTWVSVDVTAMMQDALAAGVFYGVLLKAVDETTATDVTEFYARESGSSNRAYISITYSTNTAPNAPTSLSPTGGAVQNTLTPSLSGTFSDPDSGDTMSGYQVQVSTDSTFATVTHYDSGTVTASGTTFTKTYAGSSLSEGTLYYWRARTKDASGTWGSYSTAQSFYVNSVPNAPSISLSQSPTTDITTLTPTFNVTHSDPDPTDSQMTGYRIVLELSDGTPVWDSGDVTVTATVTKSVTYSSTALSWQTSYRWKARTKDRNGAWSNYSSYATFTTHTTAIPTSLQPTGSTTASSTTPTLTGSRGSTNDSLTSASIEVYEADGITLAWSSGTFTTGAGVTSTGFSKAVGVTLTAASTYKWRAQVTSSIGGTSGWSTLQTFLTPSASVPTATSPEGLGITDTTPDFAFNRATSFNIHELYLYDSDGTTQLWSDTPVAYVATTSQTVTCGVTLSYGTTYYWKVRVSADGGTNWSDFTGLVAFTTDIAGIPALTAPINGSWETSLTPTFTGNTASLETISTYRIHIYTDSAGTNEVWDSGDLAGSGTSFSKVYDGATALVAGTAYYWKASYIKTGGIPGGYSDMQWFHINAAPSAPTNRTPATGTVVADSLTPSFTATFSDADLTAYGDYPTLYEVEVYTNDASPTLMHSLSTATGLIAGPNTLTRTTEGTALSYETEYKARFRYTDSKSSAGSWSAYVVFKPSQSPTTSISAPGATVNSPSFLIDWAMTSPGAKAQGAYKVRVIRQSNDTVVYDTGKVASSSSSLTLPGGYLVNSNAYTIEVTTWDTDDLVSAAATTTTTTNWTAPDAPADFNAVADPDNSCIVLSWTASNLLSSEFSYYQLYRRVVGDADWSRLATITTQATVEYFDYHAANSVLYDYKITVFKTVVGDIDLESPDSDIFTETLDADNWYVVGADRSSAHIFELPVQDESHTQPIQQEVFEPLGSSRKTVVRGRVLGSEGTMEVKWKSDERVDAKLYLAYITENAGPHILKSPFGDLWEVEFAGPSTKYAGGGHMGVTLTWIEVD